MQASPELKDLYIKCCEAQSKGDHAFFNDHFSRQDGVLAIGTDPGEWWAGHETITKVFKSQLEEVSGIQVLPGDAVAYADGSIGWVAGQPTVKLPDGKEFHARLTAVFEKEDGAWKIVQWHFSAGVPNEEAIGEELTT